MTQMEIWKQTYENKLAEYLAKGYSERKATRMAKKAALPLHPLHKRAQKRNVYLAQLRTSYLEDKTLAGIEAVQP